MELETVNKLYLELSQIATAKTARELKLEEAMKAVWEASTRSPGCYVAMPKQLTAENGAKALLSGEFKEQVHLTCPDCHGGNGGFLDDCSTCGGHGFVTHDAVISWSTIKEIYAMAVKHLAT